jgi:hypothetical protein
MMKIELTPEDEMIFRNKVSEDAVKKYMEQGESEYANLWLDTLLKAGEHTPMVDTLKGLINLVLCISPENSKYLAY